MPQAGMSHYELLFSCMSFQLIASVRSSTRHVYSDSRVSRMFDKHLVEGDIDEAGSVIDDGSKVMQVPPIPPPGCADLEGIKQRL